MELRTEKSDTMIISANDKKHKIELDDKILDHVNGFNCLSTIIEINGKIDKLLEE